MTETNKQWRKRQNDKAIAAADALADAVRGIGPLALEDALAAYREARGARRAF